jgi:hypothetical protein
MNAGTRSTAIADQDRLKIGAEIAQRLARDTTVVAVFAVGSTVVGGSAATSDLDLIIVHSDTVENDQPAFTDWFEQGVRVELERIRLAEALETTRGHAWIWELRQAARHGANAPQYDPGGLGGVLCARAASMRPNRVRYESQLDALAETLTTLSSQVGDIAGASEALRDALDSLAILALLERPLRYRKAKWTLTDLANAGETALLGALVDGYGIDSDPTRTGRTLELAGLLIEGVLEALGAPCVAELQRHSPGRLEESYVARTLRDAQDLQQEGRLIDAQFTAKFASRLNVGLLAGTHGVSINAERAEALAAMHAELFSEVEWSQAALDTAIASIKARRAFLTSLTQEARAPERVPS